MMSVMLKAGNKAMLIKLVNPMFGSVSYDIVVVLK